MIAERTCTVSNMGRTRPSDWSATKPASCNATKSPQTDRAKYAKRGDNATATPIRPRTSPMTPSLVRWATEVSDCGFQKGVAPKIHGSAMMAWRLPMKNMAARRAPPGLRKKSTRSMITSSALSVAEAHSGHSKMCFRAEANSSASASGNTTTLRASAQFILLFIQQVRRQVAFQVALARELDESAPFQLVSAVKWLQFHSRNQELHTTPQLRVAEEVSP